MGADFLETTLAFVIGSQVVLAWLFFKLQMDRSKEKKVLSVLMDDYLLRNVPETHKEIQKTGMAMAQQLEKLKIMAQKEIQNKKSC